MDLENLEKLKDAELLKFAQNLGIHNFGEFSGFPPRENVLKELKTYYENDGKIELKKMKKFKKETAVPAEEEAVPRRITRHNLTHTIEPASIETAANDQLAEENKTKKRVKKTESVATEKETTTKTKKVKAKKTTEKVTADQVEEEPAVIKKTKSSKQTYEMIQEEIQQEIQVEKKTTKKKVAKKVVSEVPVQNENEEKENQKVFSPAKTEKKTKKVKAKKSPKTKKVKNAEKVTLNSNDIIYDTNTNQSDDIPLRLTEDEEDNIEINNEHYDENQANLSVITNDEDKSNPATDENFIQSEDINVTKDILNRTFDKADQLTSTRLVVANISAMQIADKNQNNHQTAQPTIESSVPCVSFYNNNNQQTEEQIEKIKPKGAKITRPKQISTLEVKSDSKTQEVVVQKVVTEIIQREAGPRITKPASEATTSEDLKKKISKNKAKVPDFKTMHEKMFEKSESIDEAQQRVQQRHDILSVATAVVEEKKKRVKPTVSSKVDSIPKPLIKTGMTPIQKSKISSSITNSAQKNSTKNTNMPRLNTKLIEPKTPVANDENRQPALHKTPSSALKTKPLTSLLSAQKPSYKFEKQNLVIDPSVDFTKYTNVNNKPNLLATSSFNRRKSFDLNASLARKCNWKPHTGKLKPVELAGSTIGNHLKTTTNTNMNDTINRTISVKSSIIKTKTMDPKRMSLSKQRKNFNAPNNEQSDENNEFIEHNRVQVMAGKIKDSKKIRMKNVDKARNIPV